MAAGVLDIVAAVSSELRPDATLGEVRLDSRLDRDLGLDSLAIAEVLGRLERRFDIELPETALDHSDTPADIVDFVGRASGRPSMPRLERSTAWPGRSTVVPSGGTAPTLNGVLDEYVEAGADRLHLRTVAGGSDQPMTYGDLRSGAGQVAAGLAARGVGSGDRVALMLPTQPEYFATFFGVLLAGATPVPIYPPTRRSQIEDHLRRHARILENAGAKVLVTVPEARRLGTVLRAHVPAMESVVCAADLPLPNEPEPTPVVSVNDLALIQYTSGSTGTPKGVALTHGNLLANIRAMGVAAAVTAEDVFVSWLPLYHDMGLIGAWLGSLCLGMPLVVMPPSEFLRRPDRWLRVIAEVGGTISASPNFGYELCLAKVEERDLHDLDLSSWRLAFNGAEAVRPETVERFAERFAAHGFRPEAMTPVYGLAESAVGLAFPPVGRGPLIDRVDRDEFLTTGRAVAPSTDDARPLRFVGCGRALPGHEIEIVGQGGRRLEDRVEGRIRFRGPSATDGYFRAPEATAATISDGWVDTGDLGYVDAGELYVTGRAKDLVIRAGRNLHPEELEAAVGQLPGVRSGRVAVFGAEDTSSGTERLVVVAETDVNDETALRKIREAILHAAIDLLGSPPDEISLAPPGTLLKTSSGKLRRSANRDAYLRGAGGEPRRPVWWQIVRVRLDAGLRPVADRLRRRLSALRSWRAWAALAVVGPLGLSIVVVLPRARWRWSAARAAGRALARLAGVSLTGERLDRVPDGGPVVIVANHGGYLDAIALVLLLPGRLQFIAASEIFDHRVLGLLLRRLGVTSVDREDPRAGRYVTAQMTELARRGERLVVFPEGRLSVVPGLQPFHLGAFVVAATVGCPVVPVAIRGSRQVLSPGTWRVRPGPIAIEAGEPISAAPGGWSEALHLRDAARGWLLARCP